MIHVSENISYISVYTAKKFFSRSFNGNDTTIASVVTTRWIGALHWLDQLPRAMRDTRMSLMLLCMRYQFIAYLVLVLSHSLEGHKCVYTGGNWLAARTKYESD